MARSRDQLLDAVYDAAASPEAWPTALRLLARYCDSDDGNFSVWNNSSNRFDIAVCDPARKRIWKDYTEYFHAIDPRRKVMSVLPAGRTLCCNDYFGDTYVSKSEYYQDLLIPNGIRYTMGCRLNSGHPAQEAYIYVFRDVSCKPYEKQDMAKFQHMTGHLQRAVSLQLKSTQLRNDAYLGKEALDHLDQATFIVDARGYLLFRNQAGQSLLDSGRPYSDSGGRFLIKERPGKSRLMQSIEDTLRHRSRRILHITHADGTRAFLVMHPISIGNSLPPAILLTISEIDTKPVVSHETLVEMFGLSPAEALLAQALLRGRTPAEHAALTGTRLPTVRSHLRAVLAKTGARRQVDLVRLLGMLPVD